MFLYYLILLYIIAIICGFLWGIHSVNNIYKTYLKNQFHSYVESYEIKMRGNKK